MRFTLPTQQITGALMAAALVFSPVDDAQAARSGGRVGGRAPVSRSAPSRSVAAPQRTTNVYVAPSMGMGYGMGYGGYGMGYGGYGGGGTGLYLGLSVAEMFLREQQRQAYLQQQLRTQQELGKDQALIQSLQTQLAEQNAKVDGLAKQQQQGGAGASVAPQVAPGESEAMLQLRLQVLQQQKELELMKQGK